MTRSPQEAYAAHFDALASGDIKRVVAGYSEQAAIITSQGVFDSHSAIEAFYTNAFQALPEPEFGVTNPVYSDDAALVHWTATSPAGRVDDGVDTFVFVDGKIRIHTISFTVLPA